MQTNSKQKFTVDKILMNVTHKTFVVLMEFVKIYQEALNVFALNFIMVPTVNIHIILAIFHLLMIV